MFHFLLLLAFLAAASGFTRMGSSARMHASAFLEMSVIREQGTTSPGAGMKPLADGTFKMAGNHPKTFVLEHENGAMAIVDTKMAACVSWKSADGVELIKSDGIPHCFPTATSPIEKHFVPEERAKKLSFDRMIFKIGELEGGASDSMPGVEYRVDVTMREDSLEYDVILKNSDFREYEASVGLLINLTDEAKAKGYKITGSSGYTSTSEEALSAAVNIPEGKFKETTFYMKISK